VGADSDSDCLGSIFTYLLTEQQTLNDNTPQLTQGHAGSHSHGSDDLNTSTPVSNKTDQTLTYPLPTLTLLYLPNCVYRVAELK